MPWSVPAVPFLHFLLGGLGLEFSARHIWQQEVRDNSKTGTVFTYWKFPLKHLDFKLPVKMQLL